MQINRTTDYAIRGVIYLADKHVPITKEELGNAIKVSPMYISTTISKLTSAGIVKSVKGKHGGYLLAKNAGDISIYDLLVTMEPTIKINRCLEDERFCSRGTAKLCPLRKFWINVQDCLVEKTKGTSIADLLGSIPMIKRNVGMDCPAGTGKEGCSGETSEGACE